MDPNASPGLHYTFGDSDVAALRLRLLSETYAESSAALLASVVAPPGGALDLGCGPGYTTELAARCCCILSVVAAVMPWCRRPGRVLKGGHRTASSSG